MALARPSEHTIMHPRIPDDGDRIMLCGVSGCGKTTYAVAAMQYDVVACGRKALVFDPTGDVETQLVAGNAATAGVDPRIIARVASKEDFARVFARGTIFNWFARSPIRIAVIRVTKRLDYEQAARLFVDLADDEQRRGWVLFADESDLIFPTSLSTKGPQMRLLGLVRNRKQRLYATTNYPPMTAPRMRANTQHACVFRLMNTESISACKWFGESAWFERALTLEKFQFLHRGPSAKAPLPVLDARGSVPWQLE